MKSCNFFMYKNYKIYIHKFLLFIKYIYIIYIEVRDAQNQLPKIKNQLATPGSTQLQACPSEVFLIRTDVNQQF